MHHVDILIYIQASAYLKAIRGIIIDIGSKYQEATSRSCVW